jgi:hypothetical protein
MQMNHPAVQLNGLKIGEYLLEVSEVQPGSYDTARVLLKSAGDPKFYFDVWAPRGDFEKPQFLYQVLKVIEHGVNGGLTCASCNSGFVDHLNFLETGVSAYCAKCHDWFRIPELESPGGTPA